MHTPCAHRRPIAVLVVAMAAAGSLLSLAERSPCEGSGRGGNCALHCIWSGRLCRVCCLILPATTKAPADEDTPVPSTASPSWEETRSTVQDGDDENPPLVFPSRLPEGTEDAMLETASHILSIVSREDSEQIRVWVESPERNLDNLSQLADKLASFPRAPFGRAYWRIVLRSSRDRPFTLLREALAVRKAFLQFGITMGTDDASTTTDDSGLIMESGAAGW